MDAWLAEFIARERLPAGFAADAAVLCASLDARIGAAAGTPGFVVGICGPQASGKSTLTAVLAETLRAGGRSVAVVSIDDFYLTRGERRDLARAVHPLLATRGVPGTHDVRLGIETLDALARGGEVSLPRFDKAMDDRADRAGWPRLRAPVDIVLFEGWCVGARPQSAAALRPPINALERDEDPDGVWRAYANDALAGPYQDWFGRIDMQVLLQPPGFETVLEWRREQERKLRDRLAAEGAGSGRAMDDAQVARFVAHYERLTRWIMAEAPSRADVVVRIGADRRALD